MKGYAVIFFHRDNSLKPFRRKFCNLFDHLVVSDSGKIEGLLITSFCIFFINENHVGIQIPA